MANIIPLIDYLQWAPPGIPLGRVTPEPNTTDAAYSHEDIRSVGVWADFNIGTILQHYGDLLHQAQIQSDFQQVSPPQQVTSEMAVRTRITELVKPRVRRALRAGFNDLIVNNQLNGLTAISIDEGESARIIAGYNPDLAYYVLGIPAGTGPNRAPGDVKPSWKWNAGYQTGSLDIEFVAIRRLDEFGNLELSTPIPWDTRGNVGGQPRLTLLLALWYIGMLAAQDQGEGRWNM